jgi:hypothetical protein
MKGKRPQPGQHPGQHQQEQDSPAHSRQDQPPVPYPTAPAPTTPIVPAAQAIRQDPNVRFAPTLPPPHPAALIQIKPPRFPTAPASYCPRAFFHPLRRSVASSLFPLLPLAFSPAYFPFPPSLRRFVASSLFVALPAIASRLSPVGWAPPTMLPGGNHRFTPMTQLERAKSPQKGIPRFSQIRPRALSWSHAYSNRPPTVAA